MDDKTLQEKGTENLSVLAEKVKVVEAEIEHHRVGLHTAKMKLRKLQSLEKQLTVLLSSN